MNYRNPVIIGKQNKWTVKHVIVLMLIIVIAVLLCACDGVGFHPAEEVRFSDSPENISAASQSVVKLECYDKNGRLYSTGSGFACFADNVIVTNYHVIEGNVYKIVASTETGQSFKVRYVLATDKEKDIALLYTIRSHNLPVLPLGNCDDLKKGEKVVAIGSPLGLMNSVSTGVFSGFTDENGIQTLQFTAPISSGSSGGALFNDSGEVIGITFASYEAGQNLNLAIPIADVERLYATTEFDNFITLEHFYYTHVPIYSVDQIVELGTELEGKTFYIEGYIHSHGVVYKDDAGNFEKIWGEFCSNAEDGVCSGKRVRIGYACPENQNIPLNWILLAAQDNHEELEYFRCDEATEFAVVE